jgi:energy-coupling factor transporter ATP-binding protein EcfA2
MPCGGGDSEIKRREKAIERRLRKERFEMSKVYKILLLGTGESGKSTIIKQMRILYGSKKYDEEDRLAFKELVCVCSDQREPKALPKALPCPAPWSHAKASPTPSARSTKTCSSPCATSSTPCPASALKAATPR